MIDFHDTPSGKSVQARSTARKTKNAVNKVYKPFGPLANATTRSISEIQIAAKMFADGKQLLNLAATKGICDSIIDSNGTVLMGHSNLAIAPVHTKRVFSELLAAAASLCAAELEGYDIFCVRQDVGPNVSAIWTGVGPDYLCMNTTTGHGMFLEVKGTSRRITPTPASFDKFKTQSLNARANSPIDKWVLSYCHLLPNKNITIRWFNQTADTLKSPVDARLVLLVALSQFATEMRNNGFFDYAFRLRKITTQLMQHGSDIVIEDLAQLGTPVRPLRLGFQDLGPLGFIDYVERYFSEVKLRGVPLIAVLPDAFELFDWISEAKLWSDLAEANRLWSRLKELTQLTRGIAQSFRLLEKRSRATMSSTGVLAVTGETLP